MKLGPKLNCSTKHLSGRPLPVPRSDDAHDVFETAHELLAKAMLGLILLHVAGAAKHHLQGHRHLTARMAPWLGRS